MTHRQDIWIVYRDKLTVGEHEEYCRDETEFENKLERLRNTEGVTITRIIRAGDSVTTGDA